MYTNAQIANHLLFGFSYWSCMENDYSFWDLIKFLKEKKGM
jgi:hypothetical protein